MLEKIRRGCSVGFFGLGRSNLSLLSALPLENCSVTLRSDGEIDPSVWRGARIMTGADATRDICEDILFLSPSVKRERFNCGSILSSDYELFLSENESPIIAVTGSDGKSTTARLISLLLREGGISASETGNMGEPMFTSLAKKSDIYVLELSSFMLSAALPKADMAVLTSLSPNHLDWHGDYESYQKTKLRLLDHSKKFVISDENSFVTGAHGIVSLEKGYKELRESYRAELYITCEGGFVRRNGEPLLGINDILMQGEHNIKNLMLAIAATDGLVGKSAISSVAGRFCGLAHRCEEFLSQGGVDYYDSSIDTSPARTKTTLRSLGREVVIILGGRGKGLDYTEMLPEIRKYVKLAIIQGENRYEIKKAIDGSVPCLVAEDFHRAVLIGIEKARDVGALLLSPASASYDGFKSYEERGEAFKKTVEKGIENEDDLS